MPMLSKIKQPWNTWKGFGVRILIIAGIISSIVYKYGEFFSEALGIELITFIEIVYILPLTILFLVFLLNRWYTLRIRLSSKINLVIAYNLEGINEHKFIKRYQRLISVLKNEINCNNLGHKIKVVVAPPDIQFENNSAAEAKTQLGLLGSTMLVWGYIIREKRQYKFKTLFSFEFGYPKKLPIEMATSNISSYLDKVLRRGLFSHIKMDTNNFHNQLLPTVYFILGVSSLSLKIQEKAKFFFEGFRNYYKTCDLLRKKDLGVALIDVNRFLIEIYTNNLVKLTSSFDKNSEKIWQCSKK